MVKKSSKVIAHYWIARPLIHHYVENLDLQGDFLYEGWSFLPFMSHNRVRQGNFTPTFPQNRA